ncbi:MAG TPA: RpiB/LacA/LacB family sugar-phosphate isomerase [Tepidisphaeraceae bacterium]|nr:RpiB/LacA/LacB family sugar-phosphate isomerase [Tepidisphaeraceae bacterium]
MIITARQLQDLHKTHGGNGQVMLPYRARLTPLAADYVRARKLVLGYSDDANSGTPAPRAASNSGMGGSPMSSANDTGGPPVSSHEGAYIAPASSEKAVPQAAYVPYRSSPGSTDSASPTTGFLWWCDGPCGPAKAAIMAEEKQTALRPLDKPADARQIGGAVKALAGEVKSGRAAGGVLLVQNGALAMVFANRCPSLRAVMGTCLEAVEQGVQQAAANVLVIEYPYKTLQQMRNLLGRFLRAPRTLSEDVRRQIEELASCG